MKSAGLSSKSKKGFREITKMTAVSNLKEIHLGAKEKLRSLRVQAQQAQFARQKRESLAATSEAAPTPILPSL